MCVGKNPAIVWKVGGKGRDYWPESREKSGGAEGKERVGEPGPGQGRWEMNWETFERQDTQSVVTVRLGTEREVSR